MQFIEHITKFMKLCVRTTFVQRSRWRLVSVKWILWSFAIAFMFIGSAMWNSSSKKLYIFNLIQNETRTWPWGVNRSAISNEIYNYVKTISHLRNTKYLKLLRETTNLYYSSKKEIQVDTNSPQLIPKALWMKYFDEHKKFSLPLPILTAEPLGRLGNLMGEYATLFALGKLYNISTVMNLKMKAKIIKIFPQLSVESYDIGENCYDVSQDESLYDHVTYEIAAAGLFGPGCFIMKGYPFEMPLFNAVKDHIIKEFTFAPNIRKEVATFFSVVRTESRRVRGNENTEAREDLIYIGVHARRTDYQKHMKAFGGTVPGQKYFKNALNYYRKKFNNTVFIASSDDMKFIRNTLRNESDVFFTPGASAAVDMAILSSCNHSIFTMGSYGFWASYLAGGEVLFANITTTKPYRFTELFFSAANLLNFTPMKID